MRAKYLFLLAGGLCFWVATGWGAVLVHEPFLIGTDPSLGQYNASQQLHTQTTAPTTFGFTSDAWLTQGGGTPSGPLNTSSLNFSSGGFSVDRAGGSANVDSRRFGRELSTPFTDASSGAYYLSFMMQIENSMGYRAFELNRNTNLGDNARTLQVGVSDGAIEASTDRFFIRINNEATHYLDLGAFNSRVNFFVLRLDLDTTDDSDAVTIWRNPTDFSSEVNSAANGTLAGFDFNFSMVAMANFFGSSSSGSLTVDEIRLGTSWESVVPFSETIIPEPGTIILLAAGLWWLLHIRMRRGLRRA